MTAVDRPAAADGTVTRVGPLRVVRRASPGSRVSCAMLFCAAGSWSDPPERSGVAHLYEHAFFAGAGGLPDAAAVADAVADLGCRFNAHTHREYSYFYLSGPCTTAGAALELLLDGYLRPRWAEAELAKQRTAILNEVRLAAGRHQRRLRDLAARALYGDTPAGRSPLGVPAHLRLLDRDDLSRHAAGPAAADRSVVVLDGDPATWADLDTVLAAVLDRGAHLAPADPRRTGAAPAVPVAGYGPRAVVHLPVEAPVALVAVVVPGVSYLLDRRQMQAMRLFHTALGGNASSRLQRELRDGTGMSYQVRSSLEPHQRTGGLLAILGCAPERAGEAVTAVRRVLADAVTGRLGAAELARAREVARGQHVHERETAVDRAFATAHELFRRDGTVPERAVFDLWGEITAAEVTATAAAHLRLDDLRYVLVGPRSAADALAGAVDVQRWDTVRDTHGACAGDGDG